MNKLILIGFLMSVLTAGCSTGKSTATTLPDGSRATVKTSGDGSGFTLQGGGTDAAVGTSAKITEEQLHVPFYPGSTMINDKSMTVKTAAEESALAYFSSTDEITKIADFYKDRLKGIQFSKFESNGSVNMISNEYKDAAGGKVAIALTRKSESEPVEISIGWGKS